MPTPLKVIMWIWLGVSLGVYGYRLWRRITKGPKRVRDAASTATQAATPPVKAEQPKVAMSALPEKTPVEAVIPRDPQERIEPSEGHWAFTTTPQPQDQHSEPGIERHPPVHISVVEALAGIDMPAGLTPFVGSGAPNQRFKAVFFTDSASATTIGAQLGDALEIIGYTLRAISPLEALAERAGVQIHIVIHPEAGRIKSGSAQRFLSIPPHATVVEFST